MNAKQEIARLIGRYVPIRVRGGPSKGMRLYGNLFHNRRQMGEEDRLYSGLDLAGKNVIEAGTHIGIYTFCFAQTAANVVAFEPNPMTFKILSRNIKINRLKNVTAVNEGLARCEDVREYVAEKYVSGRGTFKRDKHDLIRTKGVPIVSASVPVTTIAACKARFGLDRIDFIKIDTEGYEPEVIAGIALDDAPDIYFELHGLNEAQQATDLREIVDLLPNYTICKLTAGLPVVTPSNIDKMTGAFIAYVTRRPYLEAALKPFA